MLVAASNAPHHHEGGAVMNSRIAVVACGLVFSAGTAGAQGNAGGDANSELRKRFVQVASWVTKAAEMVPADKYAYKPTASVRTYGQLIAHIADSYVYYCAQGAGKNVEWSDAIEKGKTDKATLVPKLRETLATCTPAYASPGNIGALIENVGHTNLHYGNIITYMRMLGLTPPSS
jgi:hypothetical protein